MTTKRIPPDHWQRARELRRPLTPAEKALWTALQNGRRGVTFRRQHPIGPFIVDFVALEARLIIEFDGSIHEIPQVAERDSARQEYLEMHGFRVRRYMNQEVLTNLPAVLADIEKALAKG